MHAIVRRTQRELEDAQAVTRRITCVGAELGAVLRASLQGRVLRNRHQV